VLDLLKVYYLLLQISHLIHHQSHHLIHLIHQQNQE
jgi:hypothetical protein